MTSPPVQNNSYVLARNGGIATMKPSRIIVIGTGATVLAIFLFLAWRKSKLKNKKVRKKQSLACQRKLRNNERTDCDVNGSPTEISDEMSVESSQSFASSITSITSGEDNITEPSSDDNDSGHSSSDANLKVLGVTGVSTYKQTPECRAMTTELDELDSSPIVTRLFSDSRCPTRSGSVDKSRMTSQNIVVDYKGQLTPKDVNQTVQNIGGTYTSIVPPLQPNTGTIISPQILSPNTERCN